MRIVKFKFVLSLLLSATVALCACGQTGDLYLPDDNKAERPNTNKVERR